MLTIHKYLFSSLNCISCQSEGRFAWDNGSSKNYSILTFHDKTQQNFIDLQKKQCWGSLWLSLASSSSSRLPLAPNFLMKFLSGSQKWVAHLVAEFPAVFFHISKLVFVMKHNNKQMSLGQSTTRQHDLCILKMPLFRSQYTNNGNVDRKNLPKKIKPLPLHF